MSDYNIGVAITAGGHSKRMGKPKAELLRGDGMTFLGYICKEMLPFNKRYLSLNNKQTYDIKGYENVTDVYEDAGPAGGIFSVLKRAAQDGLDAVLILSCDMPYYTYADAEKIIKEYSGEDALIPVTNDGHQMLAAIYSVGILDVLRDNIAAGNLRLKSIMADTGCRQFYIKEGRAYSNCNTPPDYETLQGRE